MAEKTVGVPVRALYAIPEAMVLLSLSRTQIYELIGSVGLLTVTQGRRRLVPAEAISAYVALLLSEAGRVVTERRSRGEGGLSWSESRQRWIGRVSVGLRRWANVGSSWCPGGPRRRQKPSCGGERASRTGFRPNVVTARSASGGGWLAHGMRYGIRAPS